MSYDNKIVGHKTMHDGRHEPLYKAEADIILAEMEEKDRLRAESMPDEETAVNAMFQAKLRLEELGWKDACYCPKDGSKFMVIESCSTGFHECIYHGEWPTGTYWICADGDLYPSRPILFKPILSTPAPLPE